MTPLSWLGRKTSTQTKQTFSPEVFVNVKELQDKISAMYWLPELHKQLFKASFIAN